MSYIPMHNRFVEGFVESHSWGDTIDSLSSRIIPARPGPDSAAMERSARVARDEAIVAALSAGWRVLRRNVATLAGTLHPLRDRVEEWRERRNAAKELCALDDRTLAELGLRRPEIPFVVARPVRERDQRPLPRHRGRTAGNDNQSGHDDQPTISPLFFVK